MIFASQIERLLAEDVDGGDITTEGLGICGCAGRMTFTARGDMVVAGIDVARRMMEGLDVSLHAGDGERVAAGTLLLEARGSAGDLHRAWKATQTLMEILGGIATATRALVEAATSVDPGVRVGTTRKTVPGARRLSQLAVKAGGGVLHRQGLGETVLVFAEHRAFLSDLPLDALAARLRRAQPEKSLGIEVGDIEEAVAAADAGFNVLQLEKFSPDDVRCLADRLHGRRNPPLIAAAGGINPDNVGAYVAAGAGFIVTSWPYTARPRDVSVRIEAV